MLLVTVVSVTAFRGGFSEICRRPLARSNFQHENGTNQEQALLGTTLSTRVFQPPTIHSQITYTYCGTRAS